MTDETQDTMRTKVLDALTALFPQRDTVGADDFDAQFGVGFSLVTREPLGKLPTGKTSSLGVYDITLPVVIEIHVAKEDGVDIAKTVERYLGVIERVVKMNEGLGGLTSTIEVTGDNVDVDSPYDKQADGALYMDVKFSQQVLDPTQGR
jgi:hypothetical protein